jgi:hypothetical protein
MKKGEMDGPCSPYGRENARRRNYLGDLGVVRKNIILQEVLERTNLPTFLTLFNNAV